MFTGLVETTVAVAALEPRGSGARLWLAPPPAALRPRWDPVPGESIAVSGVCLTVVEVSPEGGTAYDLSSETLERTWLGGAARGRACNVERSLRLGDRLGGHLVSGHVDALGRVEELADPGDGGRVVTFRVPAGFERWLVEKGSVAIDGVSLTVVAPRGPLFDVALIPETLRRTTLGEAVPGRAVHLEGDAIGKWVARLVEPYGSGS